MSGTEKIDIIEECLELGLKSIYDNLTTYDKASVVALLDSLKYVVENLEVAEHANK
tara:strand:- start:335 stop:502 length:168 start_codon:yes stop_codon:yes gene_type:complete